MRKAEKKKCECDSLTRRQERPPAHMRARTQAAYCRCHRPSNAASAAVHAHAALRSIAHLVVVPVRGRRLQALLVHLLTRRTRSACEERGEVGVHTPCRTRRGLHAARWEFLDGQARLAMDVRRLDEPATPVPTVPSCGRYTRVSRAVRLGIGTGHSHVGVDIMRDPGAL